jgi:FemAB-related protein (PEP-CTERM system-associated)
VAERDSAVAGVLPLVHVRSVLFGNALVSNPFCVYGGPLAADAETAQAPERAAFDLMQQARVQVLEFRPLHPLPTHWLDDGAWQTRNDLYVTFRKSICSDDEENLKAVPRKQRVMIRKCIERGLSGAVGSNVDALHSIYAESVRNLRTPVFSRRYFRTLAEAFKNDLDVLTVFDRGTPVAAVMTFYWRDEALPYYGGGTSAARDCSISAAARSAPARSHSRRTGASRLSRCCTDTGCCEARRCLTTTR